MGSQVVSIHQLCPGRAPGAALLGSANGGAHRKSTFPKASAGPDFQRTAASDRRFRAGGLSSATQVTPGGTAGLVDFCPCVVLTSKSLVWQWALSYGRPDHSPRRAGVVAGVACPHGSLRPCAVLHTVRVPIHRRALFVCMFIALLRITVDGAMTGSVRIRKEREHRKTGHKVATSVVRPVLSQSACLQIVWFVVSPEAWPPRDRRGPSGTLLRDA